MVVNGNVEAIGNVKLDDKEESAEDLGLPINASALLAVGQYQMGGMTTHLNGKLT